jgi:hypothetical protein
LVAEGADGPTLVDLASLSSNVSGWQVDQLLDAALREAGVPLISAGSAGEVVARVLAQAIRKGGAAQDHAIVRTLAALGPPHDYPGGVIGDAYSAAEWLDCNCHRDSAERAEADELEARLRRLPDLDAADTLIASLASSVVTAA